MIPLVSLPPTTSGVPRSEFVSYERTSGTQSRSADVEPALPVPALAVMIRPTLTPQGLRSWLGLLSSRLASVLDDCGEPHILEADDGSVSAEYVGKDCRFGIVLERDPAGSTWFASSVRSGRVRSDSGLLGSLDIDYALAVLSEA